MKNIGLFFGSFNPIHIGHLIIANTMVEHATLDEVWFVVSPQNPFKKQSSLLHEFDRLDLVNAAIFDNFNLKAVDVEFRMPKPSYTIDTLTYLSDEHKDKKFKLIIGEDNLKSFKKWKNADKILEFYELLVYPRPHAQPSDLKTHPKVQLIEAPMMDISATFIRKSIQSHKSIKYLVPESVEQLIIGRKLYI
ncbi:nicotinate (nicotinamide) nucleotide adenylyltransferase [Fulvivirga lutimaris]|uniref:nicotinate (nicotinamide) nucleotide adenylyltransferase n=1 Tax=Fulvivirga lutimaris TaxID=1819566 RepID=UPI0012BD4F03|nr:nicotinate (nicotinamide) nucleotide adenylyltransferase [Fulvivirga lutimaris]MTI38757.1 nicotinate-nucleotide adenylyltransferase [Fulvivirga lutimaris]